MSEPENFLSRWSRKKLDAAEEPAQKPSAAAPPAADDAANVPPSAAETTGKPSDASAPATDAPKPEAFDPASLPSLDSIGAQTDVRGFLQAGVPPDLTRAALRRAWTADPAIRDFKGLAENDWDFNAPNSMMGFGPLGPEFDVKRMLASVFGELPKEESGVPAAQPNEPAPAIGEEKVAVETPAPQSVTLTRDATAPAESGDINVSDPAVTEENLVQRNTNIASQDNDSDSKSESTKRPRSHGRALPR